jgi:hypothetical protein
MIKGSYHTEKTKRAMSEMKMGEKNSFWGKHHTRKIKRKISKALKGKNHPFWEKYGEKSPNWKGGFKKDTNDYIKFLAPERCKFSYMKDNNGYIYLHRLIMAEYLQRPLKPEEVVHHINEDTTDNRIENLKLFENNGEHTSLHHKRSEV